MKMPIRRAMLLLLVFATVAGACAASLPAPTTKGTQSASAPIKKSAWDELLEAARDEGRLTIYGSELGASGEAIKKAARDKFGINVDTVQGRPAETIARLAAETRAGLYVADIGLMGNASVFNDIKPLGVTVPLASLLALPEVTDASKWRNGRIPYTDQDGHAIGVVAMAYPVSFYNTTMVAAGEITSFMDYLKPQWRGKIALSDPAIVGGSNNFFTHLATSVLGKEKTIEMLKQLAANEPVLTRDQRMLVEWVARGKYPIGIGYSIPIFVEFKSLGAPLVAVPLKEPPNLTSGSGNVFAFARAPHPNAAKVVVNWLLSKEGGTVFSAAIGLPSQRLDVPTDAFDPVLIPPPGTRLPDEAYTRAQAEMRTVAGDIFAALQK